MKFIIDNTKIWSLIKRRCNLDTLIPEEVTVIPHIQLVSNVDRGFMAPLRSYTVLTISSTGLKTVFTVPAGMLYHVDSIGFELVSGTMTIDHYRIGSLKFVKFTGATEQYVTNPNKRITLYPGEVFGVYVDTWSVTGDVIVAVLGEIETIGVQS